MASAHPGPGRANRCPVWLIWGLWAPQLYIGGGKSFWVEGRAQDAVDENRSNSVMLGRQKVYLLRDKNSRYLKRSGAGKEGSQGKSRNVPDGRGKET